MLKLTLTAMLAAAPVLALPAAPAAAQSADREYRRDVREARRDYREDVRDARRDYRRDAQRGAPGDWRQYRNYDQNRLEPGQQRYYADRYYRDGRYYQERRLGRNDRIYRGQDGRAYCRRNDGTTGLIVGGLAGGTLGTLIGGQSGLLGALIGGGGGALLGQSIDRGNVRCR
jgi:hypothetical protein